MCTGTFVTTLDKAIAVLLRIMKARLADGKVSQNNGFNLRRVFSVLCVPQ